MGVIIQGFVMIEGLVMLEWLVMLHGLVMINGLVVIVVSDGTGVHDTKKTTKYKHIQSKKLL